MAETGVSKRVKYRIEYAAFRAVGAVLGALPVETAARLSGAGWRLIAPHLRRHTRALGNLRSAFPEKSEAEREAIARAMWENLGRTFAEAFHLGDYAQPGHIEVDNAEGLAAFSRKGGGVICAPHLSNWELNVIEAVRLGVHAAGIYQRVKNPLVDAYVRAMRAPLYPGGLFEKSVAARQVLRHVRNGGVAVILADLRGATGVAVPFFGRPAPSTPFPAMIARTLGVPLSVSCLTREKGARFRMRFEEIPVPVTDDRDADIALATARIQAALERFVRERPEQWMWAHRRWG